MLAGQLAVQRDRKAEQQLRVRARREGDDEGPELVGAVRLDLDRQPAEPVQPHQLPSEAEPYAGQRKLARDRGRVDRVVEVRMPDEHARDVAPAAAQRSSASVGQRRAPQQQAAQRHARDIRVDEERRALVRDAVAGDAEPFQLQSRGQVERTASRPRSASASSRSAERLVTVA